MVTARQREESIKDVPASITAFTATDIQQAGIDRPQDFVALTPGVASVQTAEVGDMQVSIRGINTGRDAETNFALVIDGILQTNPTALNQQLESVTQIEILKGPQGALYGRNAVAGAIIVTTRKPGEEWETDLSAGYGSSNSFNGSVWTGGPVADDVKVSLNAYYTNTDGQWNNAFLNCDDCVDFLTEYGFLGRALFKLGGGDMDFKARWSSVDSGAINFNGSIALSQAAPIFGESFYEDPNKQKFKYINNVKPQNEQENTNLSLKGDWDVGIGTLTAWISYNDQTNFFLTDGTSAAFNLYTFNLPQAPSQAATTCQQTNDAYLTGSANGTNPGYLPPFFGIDSSAWFTINAFGYNTGSGFLPPYGPTTCDGYQYQVRNQTDTSVEVRLTSNDQDALRWQGGLYYADISRDVTVAQGSDLGEGFAKRAFVSSAGPNPTDLLYNDTFDSTVWAVFGQLAYDVTDNVELALALRYDDEDRSVNNHVPTCVNGGTNCYAQTFGFNFYTNPYINPAYTANPAYATDGIPNRSRSYSQLQPKFSANWDVNDEWTLFASYGYGFRSGGFNSSGSEATIAQAYGTAGSTPLCLGDSTPFPTGEPPPALQFPLGPPVCGPDSVYNITGVKDDYKKEVSKAAEVGFKSILLDSTLSFNGALFYTDVDDMQFFNFFAGPFGLLRAVTNIDKVTLQGGELDFRWRATDGLTVFGGYAYTNGEIDEYKGRPYTKGNEVPYAPDYTGTLGAEYGFPVGDGLELVTRLDGMFVGETWFHPVQGETVPNLFGYFGFGQGTFDKQKRDAYATLNMRVILQADKWSIAGWGRNITDTEYLAEVIPAPEFGGSFVHNAPGASYGVQVGYKF